MHVIIGLGETGKAWFDLLKKVRSVYGYDIDPSRIENCVFSEKATPILTPPINMLHIHIPYTSSFLDDVFEYYAFYNPKILVIHSTVKPYTTKKISDLIGESVTVIYAPVRGMHEHMVKDMRRYDKYFASYQNDCSLFVQLLLDMKIVPFKTSNPVTLEFAKILVDTTYYAWLISYAMLIEGIASAHNLDMDELWMMGYQIQQVLGNRPPMGSMEVHKSNPQLFYADPKGIGGHCVMQNLELIKEDLGPAYDLMKQINQACIDRHRES